MIGQRINDNLDGKNMAGYVEGSADKPHMFTFLSSDACQGLKVGDYVAYTITIAGQSRQVLARLVRRELIKTLPTGFFSAPGQSPSSIAAMLGYDEEAKGEQIRGTASVVGYFDETIGGFVNPRNLPQPGNQIWIPDDRLLSRVLNRLEPGQPGSATIGHLLSRDPGAVPVVIDVAEVASTHLGIIACTGSGKSYLSATLLEELMMPYNRAAVLVVDTHDEYHTLADIVNDRTFLEDDYRPEVKIFQQSDLKIRFSSLSPDEVEQLLPNLNEKQSHLFRRLMRELNAQNRENAGNSPVTLSRLLESLDDVISEEREETSRRRSEAATAEALRWRMESIFENTAFFDDVDQVELKTLLKPGQCSILQLNSVEKRKREVLVAAILRRILAARMATKQGKVDEDSDMHLPYPVFILIEEAHHFAPAKGDAVSAEVLKSILAEGRKFGVGVGLVSQRPGKLDPDVLSQCNTLFLMRIVSPTDQAKVAESVESVSRDLLDELPALTKGQVIVTGAAVNAPMIARVSGRKTRHGGETPNAPSEWRHYFDPSEKERRDQKVAPYIHSPQDRKGRMYKKT